MATRTWSRAPILPLAILAPPCRFRDAALAALEREGRPYRVALETPSLSALRAAVEAGLAVTCRTALFRPRTPPRSRHDLPAVPQVAYVRRVGPAPHPSIAKLSELIHAAALEL
jgi:DNA-binding transcriptional LysR family regulator